MSRTSSNGYSRCCSRHAASGRIRNARFLGVGPVVRQCLFLITLLIGVRGCCVCPAQQLVTKTFKTGEVLVLEASEPVGGWLSFDLIGWKEEADGQRCYLPLRPGRHKIAALSSQQVGKVVAVYEVVIPGGGSPTPTPPDDDDNVTPNPSPPGPDVPNALGLGSLAYSQAKAIGQPAKATQMASVWNGASIAISKINAEEGEVSLVKLRAITKSISDGCLSVANQDSRWIEWRRVVGDKVNELQRAAGGWHADNWREACDEIAEALRLVR